MTNLQKIIEEETGVFNSNFVDLLIQNGSVEMSAEQQRKLGDEICQCGENLAKRLSTRIFSLGQQDMKEMAVEKIKKWTNFTCHTRKEHADPKSDCPGWSHEDQRVKRLLLEQIEYALQNLTIEK